MRTYLPLTIGPARIGGWSHGNRTLQGRVGELLIYDRPLDADAVRQLYEAGRPAPTIAPE